MVRLPEIQRGPAEALSTVSPGQAGAVGRAISQAGGQVAAGAMSLGRQIHATQEAAERDEALAKRQRELEARQRNAHSAKLAGYAMRNNQLELFQHLEDNPYLDAGDPMIAGMEGLNVRPDGRVMTAEVADQIYAAQANEWRDGLLGTIGEGEARDLFEVSSRADISGRVLKLQETASAIARKDRKAEDTAAWTAALGAQDYAEARTRIKLGDYTGPERDERLLAVRQQQEKDGATNALLARDPGAIQEQLDRFSVPQQAYSGDLDAPTRLGIANKLRATQKAMAAGAEGQQKAKQRLLGLQLRERADNLLDGTPFDVDDIADATAMLGDYVDLGGADTASGVRLVADIAGIAKRQPWIENFQIANQSARDAMLQGLRDNAAGLEGDARIEEHNWIERLERLSDQIDNRWAEDPLHHADALNMIELTPIAEGDMAANFAEREAQAESLRDRVGFRPPILTAAEADFFSERLGTADSNIEVLGAINSIVHSASPSVALRVFEQVAEREKTGQVYSVVGKALVDGDTTMAREILRGNELLSLPDARDVLTSDQREKLYESSVANFPDLLFDKRERDRYRGALNALAAARQENNRGERISRSDADALAREVVGNVRSVESTAFSFGDDYDLIMPTAAMTGEEFVERRRKIPSRYYRDSGMDVPASVDIINRINRGKYQFIQVPNMRGHYYVIDTSDGLFVANKNMPPINGRMPPYVLDWNAAMEANP